MRRPSGDHTGAWLPVVLLVSDVSNPRSKSKMPISKVAPWILNAFRDGRLALGRSGREFGTETAVVACHDEVEEPLAGRDVWPAGTDPSTGSPASL
jgi:hypothetical protein